MLWKSAARVSDEIDALSTRTSTLWNVADAVYASIYMLSESAGMLSTQISAVIDRRYRGGKAARALGERADPL